jgi:hypothetical protein
MKSSKSLKHWKDQRLLLVQPMMGVFARAHSIASSRWSRLTYLTGLIGLSIGFCV